MSQREGMRLALGRLTRRELVAVVGRRARIRVDDYYEWDRESGEHGYAGNNAGDNIAAR